MDDPTAVRLLDLLVEYDKEYGDEGTPTPELTVAELVEDIVTSTPQNLIKPEHHALREERFRPVPA